MIKALQFYLKNGLLEPQPINIDFNRLKIEIGVDFIDFMDSLISKPELYQKPSLPDILVIDKNKLFDEFLKTKPNNGERISPIIFKKGIDKYCDYYQIQHNHYKSNGNNYVELNIEKIIKQAS